MSEGMSRLEYLRLLRLGYIKNMTSANFPAELWAELETLEEEDRIIREEAARMEAAEKRRKFEQETHEEGLLVEWWNMQRQHGKTEAARKWFEKHGVEPWEVTEIADDEQEKVKNENWHKARREQGFHGVYTDRHGATRNY